MPNEITRLYKHEDETMLVMAQVMHDNLVADLATFTSFFPWLVASTAAALQSSITTANALPLDTQVVANLKVLTEDANAKLQQGTAALSTLGIYAKLTYPNDESRQRVFGQDNWEAARTDHEKMMNALEHAHSLCSTAPYSTDLNAKGFTTAQIANLQTLANAMRISNILQEDAKSLRPVTTQNRIMQYNAVWEQMRTINICSKLAFAENPAKLSQYMLYPLSAENTRIDITVVANTTMTPLSNATVTLTNTSLAAAQSNPAGQANFQSVNMPDLIDIHIDHPTAGIADYTNVTVVTGTTNDYTLEVPK